MPGAYLTSAPIVTVNWDAASDNRWTVPVGGGIGHIFHFGKLPVTRGSAATTTSSRRNTVRIGNCGRCCN